MPSVVFYIESQQPIIASLEGGSVITVGRHPDSLLYLDCPSVSSHHATFTPEKDGWYVKDIGSSNGTRINGAEIEEARLSDGDRVSFGDVQGIYYEGEPPPLEEAAPPAPSQAEAPAPEAPPPPPNLAGPPAPPVMGVPMHGPAPRGRRFARSTPAYPDQTGSGCATASFFTFVFLLAFFVGLMLRHYKETDRNLVSDIVERITSALPKVKIEER
jgi:pSer/pThr/pTyr-binding forkhead associated (FHA) protein